MVRPDDVDLLMKLSPGVRRAAEPGGGASRPAIGPEKQRARPQGRAGRAEAVRPCTVKWRIERVVRRPQHGSTRVAGLSEHAQVTRRSLRRRRQSDRAKRKGEDANSAVRRELEIENGAILDTTIKIADA
jgi:hypothetical protein